MNNASQYSYGHKSGAVDYMAFRTADKNARFALPHLSEGMALLDCGCGPGSITVGLASRVAPGEVVGIDLGESQIKAASTHAKAHQIANARFEVADVCGLPFDDESFDFVFSHTLLCHLVEVDRAIAEIRRVLRPGGCIAIRDLYASGALHSCQNEKTQKADFLAGETIRQAGGDPDFGAKLGPLLDRAGFINLHLSASYDYGGESPAERLAYLSLEADLLERSHIADVCVDQGWASRDEIAEMAQEWRRLGNLPGGFFALQFGEAVGWKPPTPPLRSR